MHKNIFTILACLALVGCTGGGESTDPASVSDWSLQSEQDFNVSIPPGMERVARDNSDIDLSSDFEVAYSEVRLDGKFATTFSVYKENLESDINSKAYAQAVYEKVKNFSGHEAIGSSDIRLGEMGTSMNEFYFNSSSLEKLHGFQSAVVKNKRGYILWCITRGEEGDADVCRQIIQSFVIR